MLIRIERFGSTQAIEEPRDDVDGCWPGKQQWGHEDGCSGAA